MRSIAALEPNHHRPGDRGQKVRPTQVTKCVGDNQDERNVDHAHRERPMVAVKSHEAERFLARPPPHIYLYLVFGTDAGLVTERARKIVSRAVDDPKDPFQLVRIGGDELANDPARLAVKVNTIPLFGGRRGGLIYAAGNG